jgi:hypothetical protein
MDLFRGGFVKGPLEHGQRSALYASLSDLGCIRFASPGGTITSAPDEPSLVIALQLKTGYIVQRNRGRESHRAQQAQTG